MTLGMIPAMIAAYGFGWLLGLVCKAIIFRSKKSKLEEKEIREVRI